MKVILLERIEKLGQMGDIVAVKPGFARNYLLARKKALRVNDANMARFEARRVELEAANLKRRQEAEAIAVKMDGLGLPLARQASEGGHLYGSVSPRDVQKTLAEEGYAIERRQVALDQPIKALGLYEVRIVLHPEVSATVRVGVARSQQEGEALLAVEDAADAPADTGAADARLDTGADARLDTAAGGARLDTAAGGAGEAAPRGGEAQGA